MRLRHKLITLIAVLLLLVLGGSFWLVFADLQAEFMRNFREDLKSSAAAFRSQQDQRYRTLDVMAGFLESSPSFRNVLRRSNYETVQQYLQDVNGSTEVSFIMLTDVEGKLLNRSDQDGARGISLAQTIPVAAALEGGSFQGYWVDNGSLYQVVAIPMVDSQDYVDGSLTLGFRMDKAFLQSLKRDLGADIAFNAHDFRLSTDPALQLEAPGMLTEKVPLDDEGAYVLLGKSLSPLARFVKKQQWNLGKIAAVALLLALLISVPLIGKMTNPVELLEMAQAEMRTIFETNLDGLLATDETGLITTCNPAATVALGYEEEELIGQPLFDRLPPEVKSQLEAVPGSRQSAGFRRQGRDFKLYRTFVTRASSDTLGSILLIHDVSQELERERLFQRFLDDFEGEGASFELSVRNLKTWSEIKHGRLQCRKKACALPSFLHSMDAPDLAVTPVEGDAEVWADPDLLRIILQNLANVALKRTAGDARCEVVPEGGAVAVRFKGETAEGEAPLCARRLEESEPWHSDLGLDALGLYLAGRCLELHHSRLSITREGNQETYQFSLPRAVEVD